jgi:hypothetical protein
VRVQPCWHCSPHEPAAELAPAYGHHDVGKRPSKQRRIRGRKPPDVDLPQPDPRFLRQIVGEVGTLGQALRGTTDEELEVLRRPLEAGDHLATRNALRPVS